jgi:hypothetical protein
VVEGDVFEVEIVNNSPYDFQAYQLSCGCVGEVVLDKRTVRVKSTAAGTGTAQSSHTYLKVGDRYAQMHHSSSGPKFFDPIAKTWIPNEEIPAEPEKVAAVNFAHTITLYMDDGEEFVQVHESGELRSNPEKSMLILPVRYTMIPKPAAK